MELFARKWLAVAAFATALFTSTDRLVAQTPTNVIISEVHPSGSGNSTYRADWFELTNLGSTAVTITGWTIDDNSNATASAVALRGVTSIPAGKSAVFFEGDATGSTDAAIRGSFSIAWFGTATPPPGVLIGAYGGSGVGLGSGGDAVNIFDSSGERVTGVAFGAATASRTFDNAAGVGAPTLPLPLISTLSTAGVNGASTPGGETGSPGRIADLPSLSSIDLSRYVQVGRFPLPEPLTVPAPPNSLLAQEVSGITYNWDTDTLFVIGDGTTSVVQITKTGELIDSMTLAAGSSPQGTEFYDTEGITYVGGGRFVMAEERDRQFVLFTYAPGTTLTRAQTQTVDLGTFAPNTGIEGLSYDPTTNGFIAVKEIQPQGIFQTNVDFAAGTATNGSATAENAIDLFDPALAGLLDFADVFALSNLPTLSGAEAGNLLVLSHESGRIVNIDRNGNIASALTILPYPGQTISVADQQHEGLTMDFNGILYVVSENGGGNIDHPELWVYAPAIAPNQAPTGLALVNQQNSIAENTATATRLKIADVAIADDGLGVNNLSLSGADAASFEVDLFGLYIKAGTSLDFETKSSYSVTIAVDDASIGASPDATTGFTLNVTDVPEAPGTPPSIAVTEVAPWGSGNTPYAADWFELTNTGTTVVAVNNWRVDDDSNTFGSARSLTGIASIAPGESVIFMETANLAATSASFRTTWFGSPTAGPQIGAYTGAGVGLSTGGDAVTIFDGAGNALTRITFGGSTITAPFRSFDNTAFASGAITQLSSAGSNGAFAAVGDPTQIGSPGQIAPPANLIISEVAPWSSGSSPVGADWFEVTNIGASPANIAGWKVDDNSESPAGAALLTGVTTIAPGESVIFIETADLATARTAFIDAWFGGTAPAALQIGSYSGSGLGLSTGGDAVNLFNQYNVLKAQVFFGASSIATPLPTFDNAAGVNRGALTVFSEAGIHGVFLAAAAAELGSPGTIDDDTIAPMIDAVADITVNSDGSSGAFANYATPAADDNVDFSVTVTCSPASGTRFALGTTVVSCTAADAAGNAARPSTFTVRVVDVTAPTVTYTGNAGAYSVDQAISIQCTAADTESGVASTTCQDIEGPAWSFNVGTNTFSATATDHAGNVSAVVSATFTVTASADSLQQLVNTFSTNAGVAAGLNAKLRAASVAPNSDARSGQLGAFENQVRAQTGKALTAQHAAKLLQLVQALY